MFADLNPELQSRICSLASTPSCPAPVVGFDDVAAKAEAWEKVWAAEFGRMPGLRWLSVPEELLAVDQAWLGGMQQLQVLVLSDEDPRAQIASVYADLVEGLSSCSMQALPPRLRLLGLSVAPSEQVVCRQVWRQLQQRLLSIGCDLVVGVDLDVVADPFMRLARLPVELQQVLG
jgi:hypothetical protein